MLTFFNINLLGGVNDEFVDGTHNESNFLLRIFG